MITRFAGASSGERRSSRRGLSLRVSASRRLAALHLGVERHERAPPESQASSSLTTSSTCGKRPAGLERAPALVVDEQESSVASAGSFVASDATSVLSSSLLPAPVVAASPWWDRRRGGRTDISSPAPDPMTASEPARRLLPAAPPGFSGSAPSGRLVEQADPLRIMRTARVVASRSARSERRPVSRQVDVFAPSTTNRRARGRLDLGTRARPPRARPRHRRRTGRATTDVAAEPQERACAGARVLSRISRTSDRSTCISSSITTTSAGPRSVRRLRS